MAKECCVPSRNSDRRCSTTIQPTGYSDLNGMFDAAYPKGMLYYWKSSFLNAVNDDLIDTVIQMVDRCPSKYSGITLEHWHGALARVPQEQTAFVFRHEGHNFANRFRME